MKSFYWHDYETSGIDPARDRPLQFAGLRTDEDLNPVGDPLVIYCKPAADCLPHPAAALVTGITPQKALAEGHIEPAFIAEIHRELAAPNTCGVGYNSIRFDDEFSRYTLYRNFYDPYAREWQHGNSRWDLIDVVRMTYALRPEGIEWPIGANGAPSFRLELMTAANGISHTAAHDALSDVEATIALARLIKDRQPRLFDYALRMRSKHEAAAMLDLGAQQAVLHISSRYPASRACTAMVLPLAQHPVNRNGIVVFDLAADPEPLLALSVDAIRERVFSRQEDLPEGETRIPLKLVHLNRSPMLVTPAIADDAGYERLGIDRARCLANADSLRKAGPGLAKKLAEVFNESHPPAEDADAQLYDGFFNDADRHTMVEVRNAKPADLANDSFHFHDERLETLLFRYRARNWPDSLSSEEQSRWELERQRRLRDPDGGGTLVLADFARDIHERLAGDGLADADRQVLEALLAYGEQLSGDNLAAAVGQLANS